MLTQLDQLKKRKNVLVLTTSNITEAIDGAFIDRADLKIHIAEPGVLGVYSILSSCVDELVSRGLICLDVKSNLTIFFLIFFDLRKMRN